MPNTKWNCIYRGNANVYVELMRRIANKKKNMNHKYQRVNMYCISIAIDYTNAIKS